MKSPKSKHSVLNSVRIAFKGIIQGLIWERNSRIQLLVSVIVLTVAAFLNITTLEYILITFLCFLVIVLELINTSVEKLLDVLYPKYNEEIGLVKDIMAGVVFLAALMAVIVGFIIMKDPFFKLFFELFQLPIL